MRRVIEGVLGPTRVKDWGILPALKVRDDYDIYISYVDKQDVQNGEMHGTEYAHALQVRACGAAPPPATVAPPPWHAATINSYIDS